MESIWITRKIFWKSIASFTSPKDFTEFNLTTCKKTQKQSLKQEGRRPVTKVKTSRHNSNVDSCNKAVDCEFHNTGGNTAERHGQTAKTANCKSTNALIHSPFFKNRKKRFKDQVTTRSDFPSDSTLWKKEETVDSLDELKSSSSVAGKNFPNFWNAGYKNCLCSEQDHPESSPQEEGQPRGTEKPKRGLISTRNTDRFHDLRQLLSDWRSWYSVVLCWFLLCFFSWWQHPGIRYKMRRGSHLTMSWKVWTQWEHVSLINWKPFWNCTTWRFIRRYRFPTIKSWNHCEEKFWSETSIAKLWRQARENWIRSSDQESKGNECDVEGGKGACCHWKGKGQCSRGNQCSFLRESNDRAQKRRPQRRHTFRANCITSLKCVEEEKYPRQKCPWVPSSTTEQILFEMRLHLSANSMKVKRDVRLVTSVWKYYALHLIFTNKRLHKQWLRHGHAWAQHRHWRAHDLAQHSDLSTWVQIINSHCVTWLKSSSPRHSIHAWSSVRCVWWLFSSPISFSSLFCRSSSSPSRRPSPLSTRSSCPKTRATSAWGPWSAMTTRHPSQSVCSRKTKLMNNQTKSRTRATIPTKEEKATTKMQWLMWKVYHHWIVKHKTRVTRFSKRKTVLEKPDAKSLGTDSKSTIHQVHASSCQYPGKERINVGKNACQNCTSAKSLRHEIWDEVPWRDWKTEVMCPKQGVESCQNIHKLKEKDEDTFHSPSEKWALPAASTKEPGSLW